MIGSEWLVKAALGAVVMVPADIIGSNANDALVEVALVSTALTATIVLWRKGLKPVLASVDRLHTMYEAVVGSDDKPGLVEKADSIEKNQAGMAERLGAGDTLLHDISDSLVTMNDKIGAIGQRQATVEGRLDTLQPIVEAMAGDRRRTPRRTTPDRRTDA